MPNGNSSSFDTKNCVKQYRILRQFWKWEKNLLKDSIAALESCDENGLPVIYTLLKYSATQAISTASLEWNFSVLRILKTW